MRATGFAAPTPARILAATAFASPPAPTAARASTPAAACAAPTPVAPPAAAALASVPALACAAPAPASVAASTPVRAIACAPSAPATAIATPSAFTAARIAAPTPVACRADSSDQHRVARAFITAAIRLGPALPTERDRFAVYLGRHRRTVAACPSSPRPAARP
jgi:hypothetical protein